MMFLMFLVLLKIEDAPPVMPEVWVSLEQSGRLETSDHFPEPVRFTRTDRSDMRTGLGKELDPTLVFFLKKSCMFGIIVSP